jgi:hypothetical protein
MDNTTAKKSRPYPFAEARRSIETWLQDVNIRFNDPQMRWIDNSRLLLWDNEPMNDTHYIQFHVVSGDSVTILQHKKKNRPHRVVITDDWIISSYSLEKTMIWDKTTLEPVDAAIHQTSLSSIFKNVPQVPTMKLFHDDGEFYEFKFNDDKPLSLYHHEGKLWVLGVDHLSNKIQAEFQPVPIRLGDEEAHYVITHSPESNVMAICVGDTTNPPIVLFSLPDFHLLATLEEGADQLGFSPDGLRLFGFRDTMRGVEMSIWEAC